MFGALRKADSAVPRILASRVPAVSAGCCAFLVATWLVAPSPATIGTSSSAEQKAASILPADTGSAVANDAVTAAGTSVSYPQAIQELRELGHIIHQVHKASDDLTIECQQPFEMAGEIDIIGGQVIPIMPQTAEGFGTSYLPPRKKYLDLYMSHLSNLLPLLNEEIDTLKFPDGTQEAVASMVSQMRSWAKDIEQNYENLKPLTAGPSYDGKAIANEAAAMSESLKGIDKLRKEIYKTIRRSQKHAGD